MIVHILIRHRNAEDPLTQHRAQRMLYRLLTPTILKTFRQTIQQPQASIRSRCNNTNPPPN